MIISVGLIQHDVVNAKRELSLAACQMTSIWIEIVNIKTMQSNQINCIPPRIPEKLKNLLFIYFSCQVMTTVVVISLLFSKSTVQFAARSQPSNFTILQLLIQSHASEQLTLELARITKQIYESDCKEILVVAEEHSGTAVVDSCSNAVCQQTRGLWGSLASPSELLWVKAMTAGIS